MIYYQALGIFIFCLLLAFLEVQIEGKHGWAVRLPTWRPTHTWYARVYKRIMGGKDLTGYHIGMFGLVLFVLHGFYFWTGAWSMDREWYVVGLFFLIAIEWDFLWFVINPYFGWKKFQPATIAWHASWLGPWPLDYYIGAGLFVTCMVLAYVPHVTSGLMQAALVGGLQIAAVAGTVGIRMSIDSQTI